MHYPTFRIVGATVAAILIATPPACSAPQEPGRFELGGDIQVEERRIYWLDADTLAFAGRLRSDTAHSLYLWTPGETPRAYRPALWANETAVWRSQFCASDGSLYLSAAPPRPTEVTGRVAYDGLVGPPDQEVRTTFHSFRASIAIPGAVQEPVGLTPQNAMPFAPLLIRSGIDCDERFDPAMVGLEWAETYPGKSYIVFDRDPKTLRYTNARLRRPNGGEQPLPIRDGLTQPSCIQRTPWNGRVLAWSCVVSMSPEADVPGFRHTVWDMDPDTGEIVKTDLPNSPVTRSLDVLPTRAGLYFASDSGWEHDAGGLHRLVDGRLEQVLSGDFSGVAVSPDGCRIALVRYQHPIAGPETTLTAYDACQKD